MSSNPYQSRVLTRQAMYGTSADDAGLSHTVPPSADVSGAVGASSRQRSPPTSAMVGLASPVTHFEEDVPVSVRQLDREEVCQPLGVAVTSGHIGTARCVSVRLTDPRDPFFLYSMTLSEDDYGRFKEAHELHVDWNGFPQDLISLLSGAFPCRADGPDAAPQLHHDRSTGSLAGGPRSVTLRFVTSGASGDQGTLRIMEPTAFREIELLKLQLAKQGDVGQKQYLAERFKFFEAEYHHCFRERADEGAKASKAVAALRDQIENLERERDTIRGQLDRDAGTAELQRSSDLHALKDAHAAEIKAMRAEADQQHAAADERLRLAKAAAEETTRDLQHRLEETTSRAVASEADARGLRRRVDDTDAALADAQAAVTRLEAQVTNLSAFKLEATADRAQRELREATLLERLKHFEASAKERADELGRVREQLDAQKQYAALFKEHLDTATAKLAANDHTITEARQQAAAQQQATHDLKERLEAASRNAKSSEALANERTLSAERATQQAALASERLQLAERQISELKTQLEGAEQHKSKLADQLRQNEDALLHMQRLSSSAGPRMWQAPRSSHVDFASASSASAIAAKYGGGGGMSAPMQRPMPAAADSLSRTQYHGSGAADAATHPPSATAGLFRDFARGAASANATPRASTPDAAANATAASYRSPGTGAPAASTAATAKGSMFDRYGGASGATGNSSVSSIPTFDGTAAARPSSSSTAAKVPTSAYFPSLE